MKKFLANMIETSQESDAKEELVEFMIHLPEMERINQIKIEMALSNQEENNRPFQKGAIRAETFDKKLPVCKDL